MTTQILPTRRNLKFGLPADKVLNWNPAGLHITQFYNTLSIFFPAGERFFIQSVRNYSDEITDPELKKQISAFIGQEGFHTREHEEYNDALVQAGLPVEEMDRIVVDLLERVKTLPRPLQLATTASLEHLTALLGDTLLRDDDLLEGADPRYAAIWRWHAVEETEHKAVCYDAYEAAVGTGTDAYAMRITAFVLANVIFWSLYTPFLVTMVQRAGGLTDLRGWARLANFVGGSPGVLRRIVPQWLDFFRPDFHPWMHDNREFLEIADELAREVDSFQVENKQGGRSARKKAAKAASATGKKSAARKKSSTAKKKAAAGAGSRSKATGAASKQE